MPREKGTCRSLKDHGGNLNSIKGPSHTKLQQQIHYVRWLATASSKVQLITSMLCSGAQFLWSTFARAIEGVCAFRTMRAQSTAHPLNLAVSVARITFFVKRPQIYSHVVHMQLRNRGHKYVRRCLDWENLDTESRATPVSANTCNVTK